MERPVAWRIEDTRNVAPGMKMAVSFLADGPAAVREWADGVRQDDMELALFFCAPDFQTQETAAALREALPGVPVVGCTTAGEITPKGYRNASLTGLSLRRADCVSASRHMTDIRNFHLQNGGKVVDALKAELAARAAPPTGHNTFALLLVDELTYVEERVAVSVGSALGDIPLVGGTAGDDWQLKESKVFYDGAFHGNSAVLTLVQTNLPFQVLSTHHFEPGDERAVITEADPLRRIVYEINGVPALDEYARLCGRPVAQINRVSASQHPFMVCIGGAQYPRGVVTLRPDKSLEFACAIDKGVVFTIAQPRDPVRHLKDTFATLRKQLGPLALVIGCDCAARKLLFESQNIMGDVSQVLVDNKVVGFATMGEQYNTIHMNNSFSCVAIGQGRAKE